MLPTHTNKDVLRQPRRRPPVFVGALLLLRRYVFHAALLRTPSSLRAHMRNHLMKSRPRYQMKDLRGICQHKRDSLPISEMQGTALKAEQGWAASGGRHPMQCACLVKFVGPEPVQNTQKSGETRATPPVVARRRVRDKTQETLQATYQIQATRIQ